MRPLRFWIELAYCQRQSSSFWDGGVFRDNDGGVKADDSSTTSCLRVCNPPLTCCQAGAVQAYNPRHAASKSDFPIEIRSCASDCVTRAFGDLACCHSATAHKTTAAEVRPPLCIRLRQLRHSGHVAVSAEEGRTGELQNVGCVLSHRTSERDAHVGCRRSPRQQLQAGRHACTAAICNSHQAIDNPTV